MYAGRGPRGYQRSGERIREDVNERLTDDWRVEASDIEVSVENGVVTLAGRVGSRAEKRRAEDIAESVSGVTDVSNQLRVGPSVPFTTETTETTRARTARA
jgi:osmotically-inducible protein OsmY